MPLHEGSIVPIQLRCGGGQVNITLIRGVQRVKCPKCPVTTRVVIEADRDGNITRLETYQD